MLWKSHIVVFFFLLLLIFSSATVSLVELPWSHRPPPVLLSAAVSSSAAQVTVTNTHSAALQHSKHDNTADVIFTTIFLPNLGQLDSVLKENNNFIITIWVNLWLQTLSVKIWRTSLKQSFTASMPLLTATSAFRLGRNYRLWADAQRHGCPAEYRWRPLQKFRNSIPWTVPQSLADALGWSAAQ